jgi:hypothetical protein
VTTQVKLTAGGAELIRRRQPSSTAVQSFCFTFSHCFVRPALYPLASSFAT